MINILYVFGDIFKRGGTEAVMKGIFDHIDRSRFRIDFLLLSDAPDNTALTKHIEECGSSVYHITGRGSDYPEHRKQLKRFFEEHSYDIVHTHMDAIGDEVLAAAKKAGVEIRVAHSHNTDQLASPRTVKERIHKGLILAERRRLRKLATHFVACSGDAGRWLFGEERCRGDRYLLFKNAIDPDDFIFSDEKYNEIRRSLGVGDEPVIGHVGTFNYQKNHEFLIRVFAKVHARTDARLLLVGTGPLEQDIRSLAGKMGIADSVMFMGSRDDVKDLLIGMDVFAFPSRFEGLGVAIVEAQASGLKCVVSDRVPSEVDISGLVTFLPTDGGEEAWAEAILSSLENRDRRMSPAEKIREAGYDMRTEIHELEDFYLRAAGKEKAGC